MTLHFTGKPTWALRVTFERETLLLTKPADMTGEEFLSSVNAFHEAIMDQEHEFFAIAAHYIKPYHVEQVELVVTYVDPDVKRY